MAINAVNGVSVTAGSLVLGIPAGGVLGQTAVPSGVPVDLLIQYTAPADGTLVSPANITTAEVGGIGGTWDYIATRPTPLAYTTVQDVSVTRYWPLSCAGNNYQAVTKVIEYDLSGDDADWEGMLRSIPAGHTSATLTMLVYFGVTGDTGMDFAHLNGTTGNYAIAQLTNDGSGFRVNSHGQSAGTTRGRSFTPLTGWYIVTIALRGPEEAAWIVVSDNTTGDVVLVGECEVATAAAEVGSWQLANYLVFNGGVMRIALPAINLDGEFPLDTVTIPQPTSLEVSQVTVDELFLEWSGVAQRYKIERTSNSGVDWDELEASYDTVVDPVSGEYYLEYVDTTVTDGLTYSYRLTALCPSSGAGDIESSVSTASDPITVDNASMPWASDDFESYPNSFTDLNGLSNWVADATAFYTKLTTDEHTIEPGLSTREAAYFSGTIDANHRSEVTFADIADPAYGLIMGPSVRINSSRDNYYAVGFVYVSGNKKLQLGRVNGGTWTQIGSDYDTTISEGDELSIEVTGSGSATRLTVQERIGGGSWDDIATDVDPGGTYIDGGNPGVWAYAVFGNDDTITIGEWKGYEGASTPLIQFVQSDLSFPVDDTVGGTTISETYDSDVTAGNILICFVKWRNSNDVAGTQPTVTDDVNTGDWTKFTQVDSTDFNGNNGVIYNSFAGFYKANVASGTTTVTATYGTSVPNRGISILEYSGVAINSPFDVGSGATTAGVNNATDAISSGSATTTTDGQLVLGAYLDASGAAIINAGTGFTMRETAQGPVTAHYFSVEDMIQSSAGVAEATFTHDVTSNITALMGTFHKAGGVHDNLIAQWKLNEGGGTDTSDFSGNANHGTLSGSPAWTTGPDATGALSFDGTDDYVIVDNETNFDFDYDDAFSVTAWVNWDSSVSGPPLPVFSKAKTFGNQEGIDIRVDSLNALLKAYFVNASGIAISGGTSVNSLTADTWHFVAVTYDGSQDASGITLYIDNASGVVEGSAASSGSMLNDNPAWIGRSAPGGYFKGDIDDVRVYNRELTAGEVATLFTAGAQ
jgi:hypothetical protein